MTFTIAALRAIGASAARAKECLEPLKAACAFYGIDTPERLAAFLANIGHESGGLHYTRELWGPTAQQKKYEPPHDLAKRLGNTEPGDGKKYRGGGFMQNTGRHNMRQLTKRLRARFDNVPDFEQEPERLEEVQWASLAAADFWDEHGINHFADAGDFDGVCDMINRGRKTVAEGDANGYPDRVKRWKKVKVALATPTAEPAVTTQEKDMAPFIAAALPALISAVPELVKMFGSGSATSERNAKAAEVAVSIAKEALGAHNEQELVEKLEGDPQAVVTVRQAVQDNWYQLTEVGGGIQAAREFSLKMQGNKDFKHNPVVWISVMLMIFPILLSVDMFFVHPDAYHSELRTQIVTAFLGTLAVVAAFWLGSSRGSHIKDEASNRVQ